jgi:predicted MFS family arabinose efflux permease
MNGSNRAFGVAALLGIYATFALDVFSTLNSSPQTTELNAGARTPTLMKYVGIGAGVAVGGGAIASFVTGSFIPLLATVLVSAMLWWLYRYASRCGLANPGQATESYG